MGVKLASKAQFYVKDIFGQIFKFVRNIRENKGNDSFLGFVKKVSNVKLINNFFVF